VNAGAALARSPQLLPEIALALFYAKAGARQSIVGRIEVRVILKIRFVGQIALTLAASRY
jgi:hypothetical protein